MAVASRRGTVLLTRGLDRLSAFARCRRACRAGPLDEVLRVVVRENWFPRDARTRSSPLAAPWQRCTEKASLDGTLAAPLASLFVLRAPVIASPDSIQCSPPRWEAGSHRPGHLGEIHLRQCLPCFAKMSSVPRPRRISGLSRNWPGPRTACVAGCAARPVLGRGLHLGPRDRRRWTAARRAARASPCRSPCPLGLTEPASALQPG